MATVPGNGQVMETALGNMFQYDIGIKINKRNCMDQAIDSTGWGYYIFPVWKMCLKAMTKFRY